MATVTLERLVKRYGPVEAVRDDRSGDRRAGVRRPRRPVGLRQVDDAQNDRRARGDHVGDDPDRRRDRQRSAAARAQHLDGVPVLRALSAYERAREHGLLAQDRQAPAGRDRRARGRGERHPSSRRSPRPAAVAALGRPASARRHGPRDRAQARGVPVRRAALEPRRQAARADAHRDQAPARARAIDRHLCHPRPGRGDDARRPHRHHARRADRTGRHAGRRVPRPADPIRRRLHRLADHEPRRRRRSTTAESSFRAATGCRFPTGSGTPDYRNGMSPSACVRTMSTRPATACPPPRAARSSSANFPFP